MDEGSSIAHRLPSRLPRSKSITDRFAPGTTKIILHNKNIMAAEDHSKQTLKFEFK